MRCDEFQERFDLLADAEAGGVALAPRDHEALRRHAHECAECREEFDLARDLGRAVKALPAVTSPAVAVGPFPPRGRSRTGQRIAALSGIAALAAIGVALLITRGEQQVDKKEQLTATPAVSVPDVPLDGTLEASRLVESALEDPGGREDVLARLRAEPTLASSFMALGRAAERQFRESHSRGNLDDMLSCVRLVEQMDSLLLGSANPMVFSAPDNERVFLTNGFWLGYTLFAMGDFEGARTALRDCIARIDGVERERGSLSGVLQVYRDARAKNVLEFLDARAGKLAPVDLDLGDSWVIGDRLRLADCRGKVVALVFRGAEDWRSGAFLGPLSALCARRSDLRIVTVAYYHGDSTPAQQGKRLNEELEGLGYEGAAGFDPDADGRAIFRAFHVFVGSATFVIVNKRGELAWYMPDPRGVDVRFAETLLLRLAAQ